MASPPLYQYSPITSKTKFQIRLLHLYPGDPKSALKCHLEIADLEESPFPVFDALSYVWGSPSSAPSVLFVWRGMEVQMIQILPSLRAALGRLRHPTERRILWVDALCINQADHLERSQQVPMIGRIFHSARSVII
jgi:hypothetical protein